MNAYSVQHSDKNQGRCDAGGENEMHKGSQLSVQKGIGAVAAGNQRESVDDLIDNIEAESGKDAADCAVFQEELSDGHAGGDPQDVQQDP